MKKYLILYLTILGIVFCSKAYSQEEFFGNHDGITMGYLHVINEDVPAFGISAYLKKGYIIGLGLETINNETYPTISFLLCPDWESDSSYYKIGLGSSYAKVNENFLISFHALLTVPFFKNSQFPMSINLIASPQMAFKKYNTSSNNKGNYSSEFVPVFGFGITQTFFSKKKVYPFISISDSFTSGNNNHIFSAVFGINIKVN